MQNVGMETTANTNDIHVNSALRRSWPFPWSSAAPANETGGVETRVFPADNRSYAIHVDNDGVILYTYMSLTSGGGGGGGGIAKT